VKQEGDIKKEGEDAEMAEAKQEDGEGKEVDTSKADDDKLWDAVDKDLGELLEETDGREDDDDEERVNGERFDRFKSGQEGAEGEEGKKVEEGKK